MMTFYNYLLKLEAGEAPPPPADAGGGGGPPPGGPGGPPPPGGGGDPLGGMGGPGGDPAAGGGAGGARKPIDVTTVWDALRMVLGKDAHRQDGLGKQNHQPKGGSDDDKKVKKHKSLIQ